MVAWWVIALAVLFPLAQVPLVLWIGRYFALDDDEEPATTEMQEFWTEREASPPVGERGGFDPEEHDLPEAPSGLPAGDSRDDGPSVVTCPECAAENDAAFRFCGECAAEL